MTKILLYSDNHFCSYSSIVRGRGTKYSVRLENQLQTMKWLLKTAYDNDCVGAFCLGDFFDRADLNAEEVKALSEIDFGTMPHYFIVGNHEISRADCAYSTAHAFLQNSHCTVYDKPGIIGFGETLVYILPYMLDKKDNVNDYFPDLPELKNKKKILLMHNDIKGIQMGQFVSKEGLDLDTLSKSFSLVVNGHLHNSSWVADNVFNIGNITGQNFSEDGFTYEHHAMIIDLDTFEYSIIRNPWAFNFYKIDWAHGTDIDIINSTSQKMFNYVATIKVSPEDAEYIRYRFDPALPEHQYIPRHSNGVACKVIVEYPIEKIQKQDVSSLHFDHIQEFQKFITAAMPNNDLVVSELQKVLL